MAGTVINKNDARYLATQELLEHTFLMLVREKGFPKVTVREIVTRAELNRGTFYIHASDKYDLLNQLEDHIICKMMEGIDALNMADRSEFMVKLRMTMLNCVRYVSSNKDTILLLMDDTCDPLFFEKYERKLKSKLFPCISDMYVEEQYTISLMGSIVGGFFSEWVRRDMKETPDEYINIIMRIMERINLVALSEIVT